MNPKTIDHLKGSKNVRNRNKIYANLQSTANLKLYQKNAYDSTIIMTQSYYDFKVKLSSGWRMTLSDQSVKKVGEGSSCLI